MTKGTKLSDFEKGEITARISVGKSLREISKALGRSKTVICYYVKSPYKNETRNPTDRSKNYHHNSREELFAKKKRKLRQHKNYSNL